MGILEEQGWSWYSEQALACCTRVGRGEVGRESGCEEESRDKLDAERGFAASLRRHLEGCQCCEL